MRRRGMAATTISSPGEVAEEILHPVVDEIQDDFEAEIPKERDTVLMGEGAVLDSLGLVTFVVAVEERIETETGRAVRLVNENAMSRGGSPFRTLGTLADYIYELAFAD